MIIFFHVQDGRLNWQLPLVLFVLSTVLPALHDLFFSAPLALEWTTPPPPTRESRRGGNGTWLEDFWLWRAFAALVSVALPAAVFFGFFAILFEAQTRGWIESATAWLSDNVPGFPAVLRFLERLFVPYTAGRGVRRPTYEHRFTKLTDAIQKSPTEVFMTREELMGMGVSELKALMRERGVTVESGAVEKANLVESILCAGGSTGESCNICLDAYESGAVLRRLRCGHKYHLECVDRWALSSLDYSRDPACPTCNKPIAACDPL